MRKMFHYIFQTVQYNCPVLQTYALMFLLFWLLNFDDFHFGEMMKNIGGCSSCSNRHLGWDMDIGGAKASTGVIIGVIGSGWHYYVHISSAVAVARVGCWWGNRKHLLLGSADHCCWLVFGDNRTEAAVVDRREGDDDDDGWFCTCVLTNGCDCGWNYSSLLLATSPLFTWNYMPDLTTGTWNISSWSVPLRSCVKH